MLQLDDVQLYDLSEAGPLLFSDAIRLARLARLRRVPAAQVDGVLGLPAAWVEAASGRSGADPESLASYWLERLAPPAATARRPRRDPSRLPTEDLLDAEEAARRLCASAAALTRLDLDGSLPSLRVEGVTRYDAQLVDLVAREDEGAEARRQAEARRAEVRDWARFEYAAPDASAAPLASFDALRTGAVPMPEAPNPEAPDPEAQVPEGGSVPEPGPDPLEPAPAAFEIPADLGLASIEPLAEERERPSDLIQTEGFETVDED